MNQARTQEKLSSRRETTATVPMASRAVALCEGCPIAKFCVIKQVAPCETSVQRETQIESGGGDYSGGLLDKPVTVQASYRRELMDDKIPFVMANLQKKKDIAPSQPSLQKSMAVTPPRPLPPRPTPHNIVKPAARQTSTRREQRNDAPDIVADILVSLFGVQSMTSTRTKKSV